MPRQYDVDDYEKRLLSFVPLRIQLFFGHKKHHAQLIGKDQDLEGFHHAREAASARNMPAIVPQPLAELTAGRDDRQQPLISAEQQNAVDRLPPL